MQARVTSRQSTKPRPRSPGLNKSANCNSLQRSLPGQNQCLDAKGHLVIRRITFGCPEVPSPDSAKSEGDHADVDNCSAPTTRAGDASDWDASPDPQPAAERTLASAAGGQRASTHKAFC